MSPVRILVIDDEPFVQLLIEALLTRAGYEVTTAADGIEGLSLYQQIHPRLVIPDILMPRKDGTETVLELRWIDDAAKIIAISGGGIGVLGGRELLRLAHRLGATATLEEQDLANHLVSRVEEILDDDQQQRRPYA